MPTTIEQNLQLALAQLDDVDDIVRKSNSRDREEWSRLVSDVRKLVLLALQDVIA